MFCKYCGQDIPETSEFCPECGKKLKKEIVKKEEERRPAGIAFALMLLVLCGSTVYTLGRVLLFGDQLHISGILPIVMLVAGLVLLGTLVGRERICTADYRLSDLLVLLCVWLVMPRLLFSAESNLVLHLLGQYASNAYWVMESSVMPAIQFPAFWLVLGMIALGLGRRGNWSPTKKQKLLLLAALALRSVLGFLFAPQLAMWAGAPMEVIDMTVTTTRSWAVLCWLWPLVILRVFRRLGSDEIGPVGAGAALVGMQLGEVFLMPIFMAWLDLGLVGFGISKGLAPLFGLLILSIATRLHRKKRTTEVH